MVFSFPLGCINFGFSQTIFKNYFVILNKMILLIWNNLILTAQKNTYFFLYDIIQR